jgi:hypothetical protein
MRLSAQRPVEQVPRRQARLVEDQIGVVIFAFVCCHNF